MMTYAQVVQTSVTTTGESPYKDYPRPANYNDVSDANNNQGLEVVEFDDSHENNDIVFFFTSRVWWVTRASKESLEL